MLQWSDSFETHIKPVDSQHKEIFNLLNKLSECLQTDKLNLSDITTALTNLNTYSIRHFAIEEAWMQKHDLDERHLKRHRMEHASFIYDVDKMGACSGTPDGMKEDLEKLVTFITNWWTFHILGVDRLMGAQIFFIKKGETPAEAYMQANKITYSSEETHLMLDSVIELWHSASARCRKLEKTVANKHLEDWEKVFLLDQE